MRYLLTLFLTSSLFAQTYTYTGGSLSMTPRVEKSLAVRFAPQTMVAIPVGDEKNGIYNVSILEQRGNGSVATTGVAKRLYGIGKWGFYGSGNIGGASGTEGISPAYNGRLYANFGFKGILLLGGVAYQRAQAQGPQGVILTFMVGKKWD